MKKTILFLTVMMLCISIVAAFSLSSCKAEASSEEVVEETEEAEAEEETVEEEAADEETMEEESADEVIKLKAFLLSEDTNRLRLHDEYYAPNVKEAFPNYEVEFELPGTQHGEKLIVYNTSGELPDVFWAETNLVLESGNAVDLTPYITEDGYMDRHNNPGALIPYKDGKIYALNSGTDSYFSIGMWYNTDIFQNENLTAPTSYEELVDLCTTLAEKGYVPIANMPWAIMYWMFQEFATLGDVDAMPKLLSGEAKFTDDVYVDAAAKIQELVNIGAFPKDVAVITYDEHVELFNSGKAAMLYHPLWVFASVSPDVNMDYFSLITYGKNPEVLTAWGSAWGGFSVAKNSEHIEEAVKLAEWLTEQDSLFFNSEMGNATSLDVGLPAPEMPEITRSYFDAFNTPGVTVVTNFVLNFLDTATQQEFETQIGKLLTNQVDAEGFCAAVDALYSAQ